jgi:hypothetical protein
MSVLSFIQPVLRRVPTGIILLTGEIPKNICYSGVFTSVGVSNNFMNGSVPESLGNCPLVDNLQVEYNWFIHEVPVGVCNSIVLHLWR